MAEAKWYLAKDEKALGPFDLAELRQMAASGAVGRNDLVCPEGGSEWVAATIVPGLFVSPPPLPPRPGGTSKLVPCAKCEKSVSDEAETCPHCGEHQPKWKQKEYGWPGTSCARCGVFNIVSLGYGQFLDQPHSRCRGCGCPLTEAAPWQHLESEMERVYENSRVLGNTYGWVAGVLTFIVYWNVYGIDGGGLVVRLLVAAAGYFITSFAVAVAIRARGARRGFGDRSSRADEMADRGWDLADRYRYRNAPKRPDAPKTAAEPTGRPYLKVVFGIVVLVVGYQVYQSELSQYALGRKAGIQHVREMSKKGPFIRAGMNAAKMIDLIPNNPNASADWNAGFRAGFKEELERMYPETKR